MDHLERASVLCETKQIFRFDVKSMGHPTLHACHAVLKNFDWFSFSLEKVGSCWMAKEETTRSTLHVLVYLIQLLMTTEPSRPRFGQKRPCSARIDVKLLRSF